MEKLFWRLQQLFWLFLPVLNILEIINAAAAIQIIKRPKTTARGMFNEHEKKNLDHFNLYSPGNLFFAAANPH